MRPTGQVARLSERAVTLGMGSQVREASRSRYVRNVSSCALSTTTANLIAVGKQVDLHLAEHSSIA